MALVITSPAAGATVSGIVNLIGTDGGVTVQAMNGTVSLGSTVLAQPVSFSVPVDTTQLANGPQTLTVNDGVNVATVSVVVNNVVAVPTTTLTLSAPVAGAAEGATFNVVGVAGSQWVNVSVFDAATGTKVGTDVTPTAGAFSIPVNMGTLSGTRALNVIAFSVAAGQSGGTQATVSVSVAITPAPALAVSAPANGFSQASPVTVSGTTNQPSVAIANAAGTVLATVTPVNGAFSAALTLAVGSYALTVSAGTAAPVAVSGTVTAVIPPAPTPVLTFYGVNSHYVQGGIYQSIPWATKIANVQAAGCGFAREDAYALSDLTTHVNTLVPNWGPIKVLSCFIPSISGSAASAYSTNFTLGQQAAAIVAGHIPLLEFGNEWNLICINGGVDGNLPNQFNQTSTAMYMAAMAGFTQGFRSVDTTSQTLLAVNGTYLSLGWLNMIVNNTLPNGAATGHLPIVNDWLTWHDYETGGNPASTSGISGLIDVFTAIEALTSKPYLFSETGAGDPTVSTAQTASYMNSVFPEMAARSQCKGACFYELYNFEGGSSPGYGLFTVSGTTATAKSLVPTFKAITVANPR